MTLENRIDILERELKRSKRQRFQTWVCFIALFIIVTLLNPIDYISAHSNIFDEIRAKRIVLADQNGFERAVLSIDENKGMVGLVMRDKLGGANAVLGSSGLNLRDNKGKSRVALALNSGQPGLVLFGESAKARALMVVDHKGPALSLRDESGVERWITPTMKK